MFKIMYIFIYFMQRMGIYHVSTSFTLGGMSQCVMSLFKSTHLHTLSARLWSI